MSEKTKVPAIEGWFTMNESSPRLLGNQCTKCGTYFFPKKTSFCGNPSCDGTEFGEVELSDRGTVWSFTNNCYKPPAPYMAKEPYEPFAIAAVELEREQMVVLGQVVDGVGVEDLKAGMQMQLVLETLYEDDANDYQVWKWRPVAS